LVVLPFGQRLAQAPSPHRWFDVDQPPVMLSAGDPNRTEDFALLVRAFARLRKERRFRLVLLSTATVSGGYDALRELATELRVAADFARREFSANPFAFFAPAGVFASSKTSERVGHVAAEALACGCPVVGARSEPSVEVLANGRYGRLVPGGDVGALANALAEALQAPRAQRVRRRVDEARLFCVVRGNRRERQNAALLTGRAGTARDPCPQRDARNQQRRHEER
jgi:glycosyltransferase involved in cell wall biosynthesis